MSPTLSATLCAASLCPSSTPPEIFDGSRFFSAPNMAALVGWWCLEMEDIIRSRSLEEEEKKEDLSLGFLLTNSVG